MHGEIVSALQALAGEGVGGGGEGQTERFGGTGYHPVTPYGAIYLKLTVVDDLLVVSFKVR